jgi:hypothetical protein
MERRNLVGITNSVSYTIINTQFDSHQQWLQSYLLEFETVRELKFSLSSLIDYGYNASMLLQLITSLTFDNKY